MNTRKFLVLVLASVLLCACGAPKQIVYFQDVESELGEQTASQKDIRIRPNDKISIVVNSKDPMLVNLFNLPVANRMIGSTSSTGSISQGVSAYTIDKKGNIDFPVLGAIRIEGMTREEVAAHIKHELISKNLVKDPVVTVEFVNLTFSIMGEVASPGRYEINKDKVTILEAISMAGDLTIYGKRENILVMREENGVKQAYNINLCSAEQVYSSPAYYLQQNDVIYIEPNGTKARQSTVNGNNVRSASFWLSSASLLSTIVMVILNIIR